MEGTSQSQALRRALSKITAALQGVGRKPVVIGELAHQAWGAKPEPKNIELLVPPGEEHRDAIRSAARGEGFQEAATAGALRFRFSDAKFNATTEADIVEASSPFLKQVHGRAQPGVILDMQLPLATCEDLILLRAASEHPADRASVVELLRCTAGRMDAQYLKEEAQKAGALEKLKVAWQEAKKQS